MIPEEEALRIILDHVPQGSVESLALEEALGRYSAEGLYSRIAVPGFASTSVDGYALGDPPWEVGQEFPIIGEQAAGRDRGLLLGPGQAIRVFTGAPVPKGTVAIVMQEDVSRTAHAIRLNDSVLPGENLRQLGEDLCEGQKFLEPGTRLEPAQLGLLASQGLTEIAVRSRPRISIISTGDELVPPGQALAPGELHESNGPKLRALCRQMGLEASHTHVRDDPEMLRAEMESHLANQDFLILSGGVSVGDHDHVKTVVEALGLRALFWQVNIKPGKPLLFATSDRCLVFGLPGNPVSSFVSFWLFVAPALRRWQGAPRAACPAPRTLARCDEVLKNPDRRPHYLRGRFHSADLSFRVIGLQKSHGLFGLSQANALARLGPGCERQAGEQVEVVPLGWAGGTL